MILILVGFLTYFFEVTNFSVSTKYEEYCMCFTIFMQDRVKVSLTLMLVIANITASIQMVRRYWNGTTYLILFQTLPATLYFKMIDIWLVFSMNLMVLSHIFHIYLEHVVGKESKDISRFVNIY